MRSNLNDGSNGTLEDNDLLADCGGFSEVFRGAMAHTLLLNVV
jgi:hypothetical protein